MTLTGPRVGRHAQPTNRQSHRSGDGRPWDAQPGL